MTDNGEGELEAEVTYDNSDATTAADKAVDNAAAFTNTYDAGETTVDTGSAEVQLTKVLEGKTWDGDAFTFKIEAVSNTAGIDVANQPMPNPAEVTVSAPTDEDANSATFSFGKITYDTEGTYTYKVTEVPGDNTGMDYSENEATITVTVTDNHSGGYNTGVSISGHTFTNTYKSELDYAGAGGIKIVKTFENADMRAFTFKVTPENEKSADKLGIDLNGEELSTTPGATIGDDNASHAEVALINAATEATFTQNDAGETYTYTVQEVAGSGTDVDYDGTVYTVTITTEDDGQGGIEVTTTVSGDDGYNESYVYDNDENTEDQTAVIPFTNTYKATGELGGNGSTSIKATKTLTNRPMVDGEFTFNVKDANGNKVATGHNDANGTITFSPISYSIDQMLDDVDNGLAAPSVEDGHNVFTYTYEVTEDTASLDKGVSATDAAGFQITVTVTDNGSGTLDIAVAYPDNADGLTFRNTYGETGEATLNINGTKTYNVESGNNAPDITGEYDFTLTGSEGAPMPEGTTNGTKTAKNDASGNVNFGDITYTMENVFGDTGSADESASADGVDAQSVQREKTFTYTVTESGSVEGVTNDQNASKTFTVKVIDNGDGTLTATSDPAQGALFSFTNTYSVEPEDSSPTSGTGAITITKKLEGRTLKKGEFSVVMTDASGKQVSTGTNDADGTIAMSAITFNTPGEYPYSLYEVQGDKGGVTYDQARYTATAQVTDNGNGTLSVTWSFANADDEAVTDGIVFNNSYAVTTYTSVVFGGSKVLDGRELKEGEFTFQLLDADGNEVATATNDANGGIKFAPIEYTKAGTYDYVLREVAGDAAGVTYDDAQVAVHVVVTDNGEGSLVLTELTYDGKADLPVFTNTYVKPVEPAADDDLPGTGDTSLTGIVVAAVAGMAALAAGVILRKRGE